MCFLANTITYSSSENLVEKCLVASPNLKTCLLNVYIKTVKPWASFMSDIVGSIYGFDMRK